MDSRNTVVAIILSIAILLGWELFFSPKAPPTISRSTKKRADNSSTSGW